MDPFDSPPPARPAQSPPTPAPYVAAVRPFHAVSVDDRHPVARVRLTNGLTYLSWHHVRHDDLVARLGGDEFVILLEAVGASEEVDDPRSYPSSFRQAGRAVAVGRRVGAINRVGIEADIGDDDFYGQSYFVDPEGKFVGVTSGEGQLDLLDTVIDHDDLEDEAQAWERGVDELARTDEDVADYVSALESAQDTTELPEASGDAIAKEFERYLRRRGDGAPGKG